jgi:hypothetical protein
MKYEQVTQTAKTTKPGWSNKEKALFHYFNPNGLSAKKRNLDEQINRLVDEGKCKTGAIIAYGSLNSFNTDGLYKLIKMQRVNEILLQVTLGGLEWDIKRAAEYISQSN